MAEVGISVLTISIIGPLHQYMSFLYRMAKQEDFDVTAVEAAYKQLEGLEFEATYSGSRESKFTGNPRDLLQVSSSSYQMNEALGTVYSKVETLPVWKGITKEDGRYTLWVQETPEIGTFRIKSCEVVTSLNWKNPKYKALVDIVVEVVQKELGF